MNFRIEVRKIGFLIEKTRKVVSQKGINFMMKYFGFYREFSG